MPTRVQVERDSHLQRARELEAQAGGTGEMQRQLEEQMALALDLAEARSFHPLRGNAFETDPHSQAVACSAGSVRVSFEGMASVVPQYTVIVALQQLFTIAAHRNLYASA